MDFRHAAAILDRMEKFGINPGLERILAMLHALGDPHRAYPCLHVVGTNGKTSTARFAAAALSAQGIACGLFTSPHLLSYRERISLDGQPVSEAEFGRAFGIVRETADRLEADEPGLGPVTLFELLTAMAFLLFREGGAAAAVIEAGMGGRWDSTNVIEAPVCVVTPIGLDHTERLGTSLTAIAGEKAAVIGPGAVAVSARQPAEAAAVIESRAREVGATLLLAGRDFPERRPEAVPPGSGSYQAANASLALAAAEVFTERAMPGSPYDESAAARAILTCPSPGRFQRLSAEPPLYVDGAHNPAGAAALAESLAGRYPPGSVTFVISMCDDKDPAAFFRALAPLASAVIAAGHSHRRSFRPEELMARLQAGGVKAMAEPDVPTALRKARQLAGDGPVVLCGSLFAVGDALASAAADADRPAT